MLSFLHYIAENIPNPVNAPKGIVRPPLPELPTTKIQTQTRITSPQDSPKVTFGSTPLGSRSSLGFKPVTSGNGLNTFEKLTKKTVNVAKQQAGSTTSTTSSAVNPLKSETKSVQDLGTLDITGPLGVNTDARYNSLFGMN